MNSEERILATLLHQETDRAPLIGMFSLSWIQERLGLQGGLGEHILGNPLGTVIPMQEELGFDPVVYPFTTCEPEIIDWPELLLTWPPEVCGDWQIRTEPHGKQNGRKLFKRTISTPAGEISSIYAKEMFQRWVLRNPIKCERDLDVLSYRPSPALLNTVKLRHLLESVRGRATVMPMIPGVWNEGCDLRGMEQAAYDIYDRPGWLLRLMTVLRDHTIAIVKQLAKAGLKCMILDESFVGMGLSPKVFERFVLPFDREIIQAANEHGILVNFHNCGRVSKLLELVVETGAQAIETLHPSSLGGDVQLEDAKKRIGDSLCLIGGYNDQLLSGLDVSEVRTEVRRCLDAAAAGGGYILRPCGQIFGARSENLLAMADENRRCFGN